VADLERRGAPRAGEKLGAPEERIGTHEQRGDGERAGRTRANGEPSRADAVNKAVPSHNSAAVRHQALTRALVNAAQTPVTSMAAASATGRTLARSSMSRR
jgi:hypothetical protein